MHIQYWKQQRSEQPANANSKYNLGNGAQVWFVPGVRVCVPKRKMSCLPPAWLQPTLSVPNTNTCTLTPDSRFTRGQTWTGATPSGHSSPLIPTGANPPTRAPASLYWEPGEMAPAIIWNKSAGLRLL